MSKEYLEALRSLGEILGDLEISADTMLPKFVLSGNRAAKYKIVEQALRHLEAIDNTNSSEALECLEGLKNGCFYDNERCEYVEDTEEYNTIKQTLLKAQRTEEENKQLEEQIGCPLDVLSKLMLNGFYYEYPEYDDDDEPTGKMEIIYDNFIGITYLVRGTDRNIYIDTRYLDEPLKLSDYKKTWWLKENKEE